MNDQNQTKRRVGRPRKPNPVTGAEAQRKFVESMKLKGYERCQTWVPIELKPMVTELNQLLTTISRAELRDCLRDQFVIAVTSALNQQRSIMLNAQWLRDNGHSETVIDEYIEYFGAFSKMTAKLDVITCSPQKFLKDREAETMTT